MDAKKLLVVLFLQLCMVALGGAVEKCAQPGALRCEEGRHQSVCLERSRVWHRVHDCAAAGGFCADGRCVEGRSVRASCSNPSDTITCSQNCQGIDVCLSTGVWTTLPCSEGTSCDVDTVTCMDPAVAKCGGKLDCPSGKKMNYPNLEDASKYYDCLQEDGTNKNCDEGEFYNACSGGCDYDKDPTRRYPTPCTDYNPGHSDHFFSNPALYFICLNAKPLWLTCDTGYYEPYEGECVGESNYFETCNMIVS